ncbi:MAG TPA: IS630 family transposase [Gemmatimonadales bacterium]|nr:IS630 family transposase [Gemmatimonadales bacterium]
MRTEGTSAELQRRRQLAVRRIAEGYSPTEIADFLDVAPRSVWRWLAAFRRHGDEGLAAWPGRGPGRPPKLTSTQEKIVLRWLSDSPTEYGFTTELWSAPRLAQLIEQEFGAHFHAHYLSTWLRQRGYTPQKPRRVPREQDDEAIAQWLEQDWPRIKHKARRRDACLLLMDESGLLMAPLLRRRWAPRGHPSESKYKAGRREKVSVAAALWLPPLRDRLHLAYQTLINGYFSNVEVAEFLGCAVQGLPGPVIAIWDGGSMHKGDPIRALVEESQGRLDIEPLPAHAPELMPVEFLWRWLKYGRLGNFAPRDAHHLNEAMVRELDAIRDNQVLLSSFFHQSDLPLPRALLT